MLGVFNAAEASRLQNCLSNVKNASLASVGATQDYSTEFSLRKQLGITGPRTDDVTGELLGPGDQFQHLLLEFSSNLESGNGLRPPTCATTGSIPSRAQLVGDFLQERTLLQGARREYLLNGADLTAPGGRVSPSRAPRGKSRYQVPRRHRPTPTST